MKLLIALVHSLLAVAQAIGAPTVGTELTEGYSFQQYLQDFAKSYSSADEFNRRKAIFDKNLHTIMTHNSRSRDQRGGHVLGINQFADSFENELPLGYYKSPSWLMTSGSTHNVSLASGRRNLNQNQLPMVIDPVESLPAEIDWRKKGVTTPVKNQGMCGSCWAFASTAVLESHIALQTDVLFELSEQQLVSCASNPMHCGGLGGCTGATAEVAFEHVLKNGIVSEYSFGYQAAHGANVTCSLSRPKSAIRAASSEQQMFADSVATISGYVTLESNNYPVLMNAVAKLGPIAVSVAAHPWMFYHSGVMSIPMNVTGGTDINHLVVLEGYGTDEDTGEDYWLVRNSWGPRWGEFGYIRLKREDPSKLDDPESACGMDLNPGDGDACTIDANGREITPPAVKVCGTSGILYYATVPIGGYLLK